MNRSEQLKIMISKEEKDEVKIHAIKKNESLTAFVNRAIKETIERDNNPEPPRIKKPIPTKNSNEP